MVLKSKKYEKIHENALKSMYLDPISEISLRCKYPSALPPLQYHSSAGMHLAGRSGRMQLVGPMGGQTGWSTSMHSIAF